MRTVTDGPVPAVPVGLRSAMAARLPGLTEALDPPALLSTVLAPAPGFVAESCDAGSLHVHDDGSCGLRYELRLRHAPTGHSATVLVSGRVFGAPRHAQAYLDQCLAPLLPGVAGRPDVRSLASPVGVLPSASLVVHAYPIDPDLPSLAGATSPAGVLPALRRLPGVGTGSRGVATCTVERAHYPRRERCVLRYSLRAGAAGPAELRHPVVYGKVHRDDRGARTRVLLHDLHRASPGLAVPRPLGYDPALRLVLLSAVPGRPELTDLVRAHLDGPSALAHDLHRLVQGLAELLSRLHEAPVVTGSARPLLGELDVCRQEVARLGALGSPVTAQLADAVSRLTRMAMVLPALPAATAHGDLTPGQVLVRDGRVGLVDLDGLTLAEPALDLGRFRAYLRLAAVRSRNPEAALPRIDGLTDLLLEEYGRARGLPRAEAAALRRRLPAYTALALLGAATSACRQLKDQRLEAALSLMQEELP